MFLLSMLPVVVIAAALVVLALLIHAVSSQTRVRGVNDAALRQYYGNKVVLVTGASSGIGRALALHWARLGAKLILSSRNVAELTQTQTLATAARTAAGHRDTGNDVTLMPLDIADLATTAGDDTAAAIVSRAVSVHGRLDVLACIAGVSVRGSVAETKLAVHQSIMAVNYFGVIALVRAALPALTQARGSVLVMSSVQGLLSVGHRAAYSASKHALNGFCESLRYEVGDSVSVTVASPGYVRTSLSVNALSGDGSKHGVMDATTASGMSAEHVSDVCLRATMLHVPRIVIADAKTVVGVWLKVLAPRLLDGYMVKRASKEREQDKRRQ